MSLSQVIESSTIKERKTLLSAYLKNHQVGDLEEMEKQYLIIIFDKFYNIRDEVGEAKFNIEDIKNVSIINEKYGSKCFALHVGHNIWPTSIKRLAGMANNKKTNIIHILRLNISYQIFEFKQANPLDPKALCPFEKIPLGTDAEVDHKIPFNIIAAAWLEDNTDPTYKYSIENQSYLLDEPYLTSWRNFHRENMVFRWLSRKANTYAHKL